MALGKYKALQLLIERRSFERKLEAIVRAALAHHRGWFLDFEAGEIDQRISCHACNERWTDVYRLTAVADPDSGKVIASLSIQPE